MEVENNMEVDDVRAETVEPLDADNGVYDLSATSLITDSDKTCSRTDSLVSCRICKSGGGLDLVSSPCQCKGSMGTVHISCLEEWLTGSTRDSCEICSIPFDVVRTRKFSCLESLRLYLSQRISLFRLLRDMFFLSVSLMNTSILIYMWIAYISKDIVLLGGQKQNLKETTLDYLMVNNPVKRVMCFFFFTICLVFVSVNAADDFRRIFYFYFQPWYNWWQNTVDVKLVMQRNNGNKPLDQ